MPNIEADIPSTSDRAAFDRELSEAMPYLKAYALALTRSKHAADDLVQDTLLRALRFPHSYTLGTNMCHWTGTIMTNLFLSLKRGARRRVDAPHAMEVLPDPRGVTEIEGGIDARRQLRLLGRLERFHSDTLIACAYLGYTFDEIGALSGTTAGTAKSRSSRARAKLQKLAEEHATELLPASWAHATRGLAPDDPYYPVAKCYEDLYKLLG